MMFPPSIRSFALRSIVLGAVAASIVIPSLALGAPNGKALREALLADYPLTHVGVVMLKTDYNRITQPGSIYVVRVPGIYADVANTEDVILNTNVANGQISQQSGWAAAFGSNTNKSRTSQTYL